MEFTTVQPQVLRFANGLLTREALYPEAAVVVNQARVAHLDLPETVPEAVHQYFDAARSAYSHAVFAPELFAVAAGHGSFAEEFALGTRYLASLPGPVRVRNDSSGEEQSYVPTRLGEIRDNHQPEGRYPKREGWRLLDPPSPPVGLDALLQWARKKGILRAWFDRRWSSAAGPMYSMVMTDQLPWFVPPGWREWTQPGREQWWRKHGRREWEDDQLGAIRYLRNMAAHPDYPLLMDPMTAAHHLEAVFDFITAVWEEV